MAFRHCTVVFLIIKISASYWQSQCKIWDCGVFQTITYPLVDGFMFSFCYHTKFLSRVSAANEWNVLEKVNLVSLSSHVMCYLLYQLLCNPNPFHFCWDWHHLFCNHCNGDPFRCEDNILFSCVRTSSSFFRVKAHLVLHWFLLMNY